MTRDDFIAQFVEEYAKRSNAPVTQTLLPIAEARMGRDLRSNENESVEEYTGTTSAELALPADYGQVRTLWSAQDGGPRTLVAVDLQAINGYEQAGTPWVYSIRNGAIEVRPYTSGGDFTLYYWSRPSLPDGTSENAVLDRWPQLYLYAVMVELHIWERDMAQAETATTIYTAEVARINRDAARALGSKPAMRRV